MKGGLARIAEGAGALYDRFMEAALGIDRMHTYYPGSGGFLRRMNARHWHLDGRTFAAFLTEPPVRVLGEEAVERFLRRRVRFHACRAAAVTFLCTLPTNWAVWPLMAVDIVFFQREVFLFSQEVCMMYRPRRECRRVRFDYVSVTLLVARMLEPFAVRQAKSGVGYLGRMAVKRGARVMKVPLRIFTRQTFKWFGVVITREAAERCIDLLVVAGCAFIAGLVSYWLFVPMAMRMKRSVQTDAPQR